LAAATHRRLDDAVADWIGRAVADPPADALPDDQLLAACAARLPDAEQAELSDLLAANAAGTLDATGRGRLDALMVAYRRGLVRKAQAFREAAARGLPLPAADEA
jgi:hypothetical protein